MAKIKCLIVDDEVPAIQLLEKYAGMIDQLEIVASSQSAIKAFDLLKDNKVDLIFLDIQMPVLNGIDFIKSLKDPPAVILTTAYREYAIDGYDLDIIDYLLKPIPFDRFLKAVDRFRASNQSESTLVKTINYESEYIFVNVNRTHHKIFLDDVLYIESLKDYVRIHTKTERLVVKGNLGSFLKSIPSERFTRIHRSYAISMSQIKSYNQSEVQIQQQSIPIGASYRKEFLDKLNKS